MSAPRNPAASTLGMTATPGAPDPTTAATPFAAVDDASLVRRAQAGDRDAFVALYRRHVDDVYGFALRQLGSVQDAEDVTSETFLKVVAALATFDGPRLLEPARVHAEVAVGEAQAAAHLRERDAGDRRQRRDHRQPHGVVQHAVDGARVRHLRRRRGSMGWQPRVARIVHRAVDSTPPARRRPRRPEA